MRITSVSTPYVAESQPGNLFSVEVPYTLPSRRFNE